MIELATIFWCSTLTYELVCGIATWQIITTVRRLEGKTHPKVVTETAACTAAKVNKTPNLYFTPAED